MSDSNNLSPKQVNPLEKTAGFENPHGKWSFKVGDIVNMAASKGKLNTFNPQIFAPQLEGRLGESTEENRARTNAVDMSHPIVVLKHPDGTHSLLDGTHRVQNALEKGIKGINARIVTHKDMQPWQQKSTGEADEGTAAGMSRPEHFETGQQEATGGNSNEGR